MISVSQLQVPPFPSTGQEQDEQTGGGAETAQGSVALGVAFLFGLCVHYYLLHVRVFLLHSLFTVWFCFCRRTRPS